MAGRYSPRAGATWQDDQFISRLARRIGYGLGGGSPKDITNTDLEREPSVPTIPQSILPSILTGPGTRDYDLPDTLTLDFNKKMPYHEGDAGSKAPAIGHRDVKPENVPAREVGEIELDGDVGNNLKELTNDRMTTFLDDHARARDSYTSVNQFEDQSGVHLGQRQLWVAVDLDGTILEDVKEPEVGEIDLGSPPSAIAPAESKRPEGVNPPSAPEGARQIPLGPPVKGAKEVLTELARLGWRVSIYTARFGDENLSDEVVAQWAAEIAEHLKSHGVPFSDVWVGRKPRCDYFIDDKAVHFDGDWDEVLKELTLVNSPPRQPASEKTVQRSSDSRGYEGDPNDFNDPLGDRAERTIDRPPELEGPMFGTPGRRNVTPQIVRSTP